MAWRTSGPLRRVAACVAIAALTTALTAWLAPRGWFERLDGVLGDLAFPRGEPDPSVVVVGIDRRSLAEVDPNWPWPRERLAALVGSLGEAGARAVVLDLVLAGPRESDARLAAAMAQVPTVLASAPGTTRSRPDRPVEVDEAVEPTPELAGAAAAVGHSQVLADPADGVVRRLPAVVETSDHHIVAALSLAALAVSDGVDATPILRRDGGVQVGDVLVPTDDRYRMRVSWPEGLPPGELSSSPPVLSAAAVLDGTFVPEEVRDRVVFVGVTDATLGDQLTTPVTKRVPDPGVMAQAAAFHTMASRQFLAGPDTAETLLWVAVLSLLAALAVQFLPHPHAAISSVSLLALGVVLPVSRAASGTLLHGVYPALAVAVAVPLSGGVRYLAETRLRRRVAMLFSRYVPPPVAEELVREGRLEVAVEGQRLEVTVFFCDLRGFTPMAASLRPAQVNRMLSEYYEYVSARVLAAGGTIIQYVGDEVFAVFGAPVPAIDHTTAALRCAMAVQGDRHDLERTLGAAGLPMVEFGIGLHTGEVVAVHAGSSFRRQYSVVGDPVNVGSRLCGQAAAGEVVASSATTEAAAPVDGGVPFEAELKGVTHGWSAWRFRADAGSEPGPGGVEGTGPAPSDR